VKALLGALAVVAGALCLFQATLATSALPSTAVFVELAGGHCSGTNIGGGRILTAAHCLDGNAAWVVRTETGVSFPATEVIWSNSEADVGVLRVPGFAGLAGSKLACRDPEIGEELFANANPYGYRFVRAWGRVAQVPRFFDGGVNEPTWQRVFDIDITTGPGASGAALYDAKGSVVGVLVGALELKYPVHTFAVAVPGKTVCDVTPRR
jgi:S1-C subfamily serine protease